MQKHFNLSKRALAMILVVAMLLPVFSSLSMFGVSAAEEETSNRTTTDGTIVAENYNLTAEEKELLESGYLIGATHSYLAPNASDDLISIDTDTKTVTAKSFEETKGYLWNPVSAEIVVNVSGVSETVETINFTNNKATYTTEATAFSVIVNYEVRKEISTATQGLLLGAPTYLKEGIDNLDKVLDPDGEIMKALNSFTSFSLQNLPKDADNPNADQKGVLRYLLEDGYKYEVVTPLFQTTVTLKFKDTIITTKEGMEYTEQEAAAELVAQLNANDGKLNLAVIAAEYAAASSKVEYLEKNAAKVKDEIVKTCDLLYSLTDDSGTLIGPLSMMDSVPTLKALLESYIGDIVFLAGDKSWADPDRDKTYELVVNRVGALEEYCADDAWKIIGKNVLRDGLTEVDYQAIDILVLNLDDELKGTSTTVTNPLVVESTTVQFNMSMYDVKINVTLKVTDGEIGSVNTIDKNASVTLTLGQNATKAEIENAINASKAELNALTAWADKGWFAEGKFDRTVSELPDTLTKDIEYNITYTPKTYNVTLNGVPLSLPYGYQLQLPVHADAEQSYDYWVDGVYYAQGDVVTVTDDTVITRGEGKAYTAYSISAHLANTYFAGNAKASAIITSGALNVALANTVVKVRVPDDGDGLVTLRDSKLTASAYASSYEDLRWVPYTYTVVTENGSNTYKFNGETTVIIEEADYVRVEVAYRLSLATITSDDVKDLLDLVGVLSSEAAVQKAALDRLNGYYSMMGKDTISVGILNGLKSFVTASTDISEESKTALINAIEGVVYNCFEGDTLRMYGLLTGYRSEGLAYYYKNSSVFMNEINVLGNYLTGIVEEEDALKVVVDSLGQEGLSSQIDKLSKLEGAIAELKNDLTAPNAAIDLNSKNLEKLTDALEMTGDVDYTFDGGVLYLVSDAIVVNAETKTTVQITVQGETLPSITFDNSHVLTADDIKAITDAIDKKVAEKNLADKYYTTNYNADDFTALIGQAAGELEQTKFVFTYEAKEYTVKIEGAADATIGIGNLKVTLPASSDPAYRYDYYVNGAKVTSSSYTFTMTQFDAIIAAGGFTIERVVVDVREEEYKALVNDLNDAIGSDLIVFVLTKNNGEYAIVMKLDSSNPTALAGAVKALATKLINYSYVAFEDNAFIYDDGGSKISFQALVNTIMDSGFGSDTIIGMMNANGVIKNMTMPGDIISDKKVAAAGALLAETEFCLGTSKDQLSYQIPMYITMGAAPDYLTQLRNLLADQLGAYFTFACEDGKAALSFNMPQKAYEAYLAVLLATDNVDITDVNGINEDVALGFLENVVRPLMLSDASASSVENTLAKFGFEISFSKYEKAFEYLRSLYKKTAFAYDDLDSSYDTGIDISIAEYLDSMNLGNLSNMIVEKDTGIHVDLGVSLVNLDKTYEALFFDIGAQGVTNKFGLVEDIASKLGSMSGTTVVILLSDVESDLTFKTTTVLNLNGFTVNGNITCKKGSVRIVDSVIGADACGVVTGTISGNVLIAGGKYATDVSAFIPNGYEQDENGVVSNKFMTIVRDENDNINVKLNAGILSTNSIPDVKTLAVDIVVELLLNGYSANKLYFNDKKVFELTVDDIVGLYAATDRKEALMQNAMTMVDGQDLVDIINILLGDLTNFESMKDVLDQDIANGTETPLFTYDLLTGTWGFSVDYVEEDDSITANITSGQDQHRKLNIILTGDADEKQYVADLLGILVDTTEASVSVKVAASKKASTFSVTVGVNADVRVDFSKDSKYVVMFSVILADGIGAPANADLVAGLKTYFETDDMTALNKAFDKVTLAQIVTAVENFQRNDTFAGMLKRLGLNGYDTTDAAALEADIHSFAKLLGILARRVDVTGPSIKMEAAFDEDTYAYVLDKENIKRSFDLDLVAGYSATLTAELLDVYASVKLFSDPSIPQPPQDEIDYSYLNAAIALIEDMIANGELVEDDYTPESWNALMTALNAAKALVDNATTQDEVDDAVAALEDAYNGLTKKTPVTPPTTVINYYNLRVEILRIEGLNLVEDDYTPESWNVLVKALSDAKALVDNATTQAQVDAALVSLKEAYAGLTLKAPAIDYSALQAEIDRIEDLNLKKDDYTETTWSVFEEALAAAKALINNASTQAEVDSALSKLTDAVNGLTLKPVTPPVDVIDYTALKAEIDRIEALGLVEGDYTAETWTAFKGALDAAKALINNANAQKNVDDALAELTAAYNALAKKEPVTPTIDYSALQAEIDRIEALGLVEGDYTAETWTAFKGALDAAKALINKANAQKDVDDALAELTAAYNALAKKEPTPPAIDYTALQNKINEIKALIDSLELKEDDYTAESWAAFMAAYNAANNLLNTATTQEEVTTALAALEAAYAALEKKTVTPPPAVDYSALQAEIDRIEGLNLKEGDYTAESWNVFKAALAAAKALINNAATQAEVDNALAVLTAAYDALVASEPVTPPGGDDKPTEPVDPKPTEPAEEEGNSLIWIIIISALVIAGVAVAVFVVINVKKKKKTTDSTPLVDYNIDEDNT